MKAKILALLTPANRKAVYGFAAALFAVLVGFGVVDATQSGQWLDLLDKGLGFAALVTAFLHTDPSAPSGRPEDAASSEE
jgi:hypothetical protein